MYIFLRGRIDIIGYQNIELSDWVTLCITCAVHETEFRKIAKNSQFECCCVFDENGSNGLWHSLAIS
jgi:hypothetical protein